MNREEKLQASELTELFGKAKELVVRNRWAMYRISHAEERRACFMLTTEENDYLLDSRGYPLTILEDREGIEYESRIILVQ